MHRLYSVSMSWVMAAIASKLLNCLDYCDKGPLMLLYGHQSLFSVLITSHPQHLSLTNSEGGALHLSLSVTLQD